MSWLSRAARGVGRAGKAYLNFGRKNVLPVAATIAGQTLIPIPGVGAAVGSAVGGALSRGRFDPRAAVTDAASGALMGGIASRLGVGAASRLPGVPSVLGDLTSGTIDLATGKVAGAAARSAAAPAASAATRNIASRLFGSQGIAALTGAASAGADFLGQRDARNLQERRIALEEEETRRTRERQERNDAALDPMRARIMQQFMSRFGLQGNS